MASSDANDSSFDYSDLYEYTDVNDSLDLTLNSVPEEFVIAVQGDFIERQTSIIARGSVINYCLSTLFSLAEEDRDNSTASIITQNIIYVAQSMFTNLLLLEVLKLSKLDNNSNSFHDFADFTFAESSEYPLLGIVSQRQFDQNNETDHSVEDFEEDDEFEDFEDDLEFADDDDEIYNAHFF